MKGDFNGAGVASSPLCDKSVMMNKPATVRAQEHCDGL